MRALLTAILLVIGEVAMAAPWGRARGVGIDVPLATTDATGAAALTDAMLPAGTEEIIFLSPVGGVRAVGTFALANRTLRFVAESEGVTLRTTGAARVFRLKGGAWSFSGLKIEGSGLREPAPYEGGAIDCLGGSLTVTNCSFTNLGMRFGGGAVSARMMTGDVTFTDCRFTRNVCGPINGTGGAIYASGVRGRAEVTLTLDRCRFEDNASQSGGAVTTVCTTYDEEDTVRLVIRGCHFENNRCDYAGGAVNADGSVEITNTMFVANMAGVQGGALCLGGMDRKTVDCRIRPGVEFRRNRVVNDKVWTCGGAIAVWGEGANLSVDGRLVRFAENSAASGENGYGGAIFAAENTQIAVSRAEFNNNTADDGGGAVYAWGGEVAITTSVFSNDTVVADNGFGGAISADSAALSVTNTTIRYANRGAVNAFSTETVLINTVVADNGDETDIEVFGEGANLWMTHSAYGTIVASEEVISMLVTNACISGVNSNVYRGTTLLLDVTTPNPVASEGMPQEATDYRDVDYGWQEGQHFSMGAFECPAPPDPPSDPVVDISNVAWYHNRADGKYYPRVTLKYVWGDATRIQSIRLMCGEQTYELTEAQMEEIRGATKFDQEFNIGVNTNRWVPSAGSGENFGYIIGTAAEKAEAMIFTVTDPTRSTVSVIGAENKVWAKATVAPVNSLPKTTVRRSVAMLSMAMPVAARFTEFSIGERLSGVAEVSAGAQVELYGCARLGEKWENLGVLDIDAEGRFTAAVPETARFFKLQAEVSR